MISMPKRLLAALAAFMLILTGCTKAPGPEGPAADPETAVVSVPQKMKWNMGSEPKTLDPHRNAALDAANVINNLFSGLMRERGGTVVPELAEDVTVSDDQLTYTFTLKESYWSDGKPLTAADFEYGWRRMLKASNGMEYAFQLFYIQGGQDFYEGKVGPEGLGIKVVNDRTLQVTLIAPTSYFLELTAFPAYFPMREDLVAADTDGAWAKAPERFVGNGPFVLKAYQPGSGLVLVPNEKYVGRKDVALEQIDVLFDPNAEKSLADFEEGLLDIADSVPVAQITEMEAENESFYIFPHIGTHFYYLNANHPVLKDLRVRKALSLAVDRTAIVSTVTKAGQIPATGIVPMGIRDSEGNLFREKAGGYGIPVDYADVETAKRLLAEAGYPEGAGFPELEIKVDDTDEYEAIAYFVAASWEENLKIKCKVSTYPWANLQDLRNSGDYMVARGGWIGDYSDPMTFLDLFLSYSGNNDAHWGNVTYDNLIEEAKLLSGPERSKRLYEAEKLLTENEVVIPLYYLTDPALVSKALDGWERTGMGFWYLGGAKKVKP